MRFYQGKTKYYCGIDLHARNMYLCIIDREGEILSPSGRCRAFDAASEGTVLTGGAAVVALRRLTDAYRDGDPILAVIKGSAVNNDGTSKISFWASSAEGQVPAMIEAMDTEVGRILAALDAWGLAENMLVIFTSDNGAFGGVSDLHPLRACKGYLYEGGIREPFIIKWPVVAQANSTCDIPVIGTDFYPTSVRLTCFLTKGRRPWNISGPSNSPGMARELLHYSIHLLLPVIIGVLAYHGRRLKAVLILLSGLLIDLDHLLAGRQAFQDFLTHRPLFDVSDEAFNDAIMNIRL